MSQRHGLDGPLDATHGDAVRWHLGEQERGGWAGQPEHRRSTFGISEPSHHLPRASGDLLLLADNVSRTKIFLNQPTVLTSINLIILISTAALEIPFVGNTLTK